jgi:hypothetical protein
MASASYRVWQVSRAKNGIEKGMHRSNKRDPFSTSLGMAALHYCKATGWVVLVVYEPARPL